ncbi:nucleoside triphosphate pyrophosphohydrolase family protein [Sulfobacillus thermosulfidooxidans]|uniref:nucleoside triphosphate pyrophosphohydrolase family protein n=1 Tax=Sulfobacillus thermosulfidooxidans TaxID=28034 RepID=UPI0006B471BA|nr:nucleoside triphosphate pyrophosphohydrolase family protein [Sulfobacillus thermosulfidooxidans]
MADPLKTQILALLQDLSEPQAACQITPNMIARIVNRPVQEVFEAMVHLSDDGLVLQHFRILCPFCSHPSPCSAPEIDKSVICPACHHTFPLSLDHLIVRFALSSAHPNMTITDAYHAVETFHAQNGFPITTGTRHDLLLRLALMQEELGEIASVVTKAPRGTDHTGFTQTDWDHLTEELTDLLYLWIGTAVHCGWTPTEIAQRFHDVHHKNMGRAPRHTALNNDKE